MPELLNVKQVAAMLSVSARHVQKMAAAGKLPQSILLGRSRRWSQQGIMDWIRNGCPENGRKS